MLTQIFWDFIMFDGVIEIIIFYLHLVVDIGYSEYNL